MSKYVTLFYPKLLSLYSVKYTHCSVGDVFWPKAPETKNPDVDDDSDA